MRLAFLGWHLWEGWGHRVRAQSLVQGTRVSLEDLIEICRLVKFQPAIVVSPVNPPPVSLSPVPKLWARGRRLPGVPN